MIQHTAYQLETGKVSQEFRFRCWGCCHEEKVESTHHEIPNCAVILVADWESVSKVQVAESSGRTNLIQYSQPILQKSQYEAPRPHG